MVTKFKNLSDYGYNTNKNTYVIAEIGINHGGSINTAMKLIESASKTGCDAVKFQTYITEKRLPKGNKSIYDILKRCELSFSDFEQLKNFSNSKKLDFFSTPFDHESVDFLEKIGVNFYKVASFDIVNKTLLKHLAEKEKPIIMSVGMANLKEINDAYKILGHKIPLTLMHCISAYPTMDKDSNLKCISNLYENFPKCVIGHSDHTNGIKSPIYGVLLGSQVIEKHYKIDNSMDCVDGPVSITEIQMREMVYEIRQAEFMLGNGNIDLMEVEKSTTQFRRET